MIPVYSYHEKGSLACCIAVSSTNSLAYLLVASCDGAVLSLGEIARPGAPPPEPPLALRCASEAAAAEAVAAIVAAQKDREDLLRSGCKATGAGLGT